MALKLQIHRFAAAVLKTFSELSAERTREEVVEAKQFQPSKVLCSEKNSVIEELPLISGEQVD
jgi:hypothetical protein